MDIAFRSNLQYISVQVFNGLKITACHQLVIMEQKYFITRHCIIYQYSQEYIGLCILGITYVRFIQTQQ